MGLRGFCGQSVTCSPSEEGLPGGVTARSRRLLPSYLGTWPLHEAPVTPHAGLQGVSAASRRPKAAPSALSLRTLQGWTPPSSG